MSETIPYESYYEHALELNREEQRLQEEIVPDLPDMIIDTHVHASAPEHYNPEGMSETVYGHMMSTFPVTTLEMSNRIDQALVPGIEVRKIRFAQAFAGIDHFAVTKYLLDQSSPSDAVAVFGLSGTTHEVEETTLQLRDPRTVGLKVYYLSSGEPMHDLHSYLPTEVAKVAEEEGKPIVLHLPLSLYRSAHEVADLAQEYPKLKIILAHLGVVHVPRKGYGDILRSLAAHPNVYADTAHVHNPELIAMAIKYLGPDRIMYGSDEPLNLLRAVIYDNPELGPRILTDHPYHWVNSEEYRTFRDSLDDKQFVHSQWQQYGAILDGIGMAGLTKSESEKVKHQILHENAEAIYELD